MTRLFYSVYFFISSFFRLRLNFSFSERFFLPFRYEHLILTFCGRYFWSAVNKNSYFWVKLFPSQHWAKKRLSKRIAKRVWMSKLSGSLPVFFGSARAISLFVGDFFKNKESHIFIHTIKFNILSGMYML